MKAIVQAWTFFECFWWGVMTLSTVGHDMNPGTLPGKFFNQVGFLGIQM